MLRSEGKVSLARRFLTLGGILVAALGGVGGPFATWAADGVSERIVTDPLSGIAIFGYDPVGYFLYARPAAGVAAHELPWAGVVWRFESEANREAFRRAPEVFAPAYGGYDAEGIARGAATMPDPTVFQVIDGRLFLFRSEAAKQRFLAESGPPAADAEWPKVAAGLRP
jgi:YHS domain-containing protein